MVLSTDSLNPYTYNYEALMIIQVMHYIPFQQCPTQSDIQLKFVIDRPGWQKSFFQDMVDLEIFDPSVLTLLDCIRFWFMSILRQELKDTANEWNHHLLSPKRNNTASARPDVMNLLPPSLWNYGPQDQHWQYRYRRIYCITSAVVPSDFSDEFGEF